MYPCPGVFVCPGPRAPFHWFNRYAYLKLGIPASCQLYSMGITVETKRILSCYWNCYLFYLQYDAVRINQIYEQAKWAIISEELDTTEEESMMFGALQMQIQLQSSCSGNDTMDAVMGDEGKDDIDAALSNLQESLEGSTLSSPGDITHIPELADYVKFLKWVIRSSLCILNLLPPLSYMNL